MIESRKTDAGTADVQEALCVPRGEDRCAVTPLSFSEDAVDSTDLTDCVYEQDSEILALLRIIRGETREQQRSDAFAALCARFRPLTEHMVAKYGQSAGGAVSSFDRQELEEEACIALYRAALFYHAGTHATFGYFARVCIRNRLVSFLRKQKHEEQMLSFDTSVEERDDIPYAVQADALTVGDVGDMVVRRDAFRALFDRFLDSLTAYEKQVFHRYVKGCSYKEIAGALQVPLKSVDNAVYRIRVKLKQQLQAQ